MATLPPVAPGAPPPPAPTTLQIQQKYAWDWFSYHATQRMTALNYFFVTMGILAVAYSKCVEKEWVGFGFIMGVLGVISSVAFSFLDVRNEELVNCGRKALLDVEKELGMTVRQDDYARTFLRDSTGWFSGIALWVVTKVFPDKRNLASGKVGRGKFWGADVFAHHFWIRAIQFFAFAAYAGGAFFALKGYPPLHSWRLWECLHR